MREPKKKIKTVCGIDEAGRGPVLGPMVISGVRVNKYELDLLSKIGVKDSKKLTKTQRADLSKRIREICTHKSIILSANDIDNRVSSNITLNRLELLKMVEIINFLKPEVAYIDAADVNEQRFGNLINQMIEDKSIRIISKHKADALYPIVSAASIIAKDMRDSIIDELHTDYGDFGSGYPSDEKTIFFLTSWIKKHRRPPKIARKTWETVKNIMNNEVLTKKLSDYI